MNHGPWTILWKTPFVLDHIHLFPPHTHVILTKSLKYEYSTVVINFDSIIESVEASFKKH